MKTYKCIKPVIRNNIWEFYSGKEYKEDIGYLGYNGVRFIDETGTIHGFSSRILQKYFIEINKFRFGRKSR